MSDYTAKEVSIAIGKADLYDAWWHDLEVSHSIGRPVTLNIRNEDVPVNAALIDAESEGDAFAVIKIGDQLFRKWGYYSSHEGTTWDGSIEEVESYREYTTFYRRKEK